jgi:hypothetical protein
MADTPVWTLDFMREEALALAGPYNPASEPFSALWRAADALREAAAAVRRYDLRNGGLPVIGLVQGDGTIVPFGRQEA